MTAPSVGPPPSPDYPVVLLVAGRPCLVVGGGPVAERKAVRLLESGALVTVVAPQVVASLVARAQPGAPLLIERRPYRVGEAAGFALVVTATGVPEVDRTVVADATAAGCPVNSADSAVPGTVRLPALHREGPVTVAVSTGGAGPAVARWVRDRIAAQLPTGLDTLTGLVREARTELRSTGRPTDTVDWERLLDDPVAPLVFAGRLEEARAALRSACGLPPSG